KRVLLSRQLLGFDNTDGISYERERSNPQDFPAVTDLHSGEHGIRGEVKQEDQPVPGVLVKLQMIIPQDSTHLQGLTAYARTGDDGRYAFNNLAADRAYEVLPLRPGFEFGRTQGIA